MKGKTNYETFSNYSETDSFLFEKSNVIKNKLEQKRIKKFKTFFSNDSKSSCFFIISIIVISFLLYNFIPHCYQLTNRNYSNNNLKYFSNLLSKLDQYTKSALLVSQIIFIIVVYSINNTIKDKLLEIKSFNLMNFINIYIFSLVSIASIICLTFYPEYTDDFNKSLNLVDNILFTFYLLSSYIVSSLIYFQMKNFFGKYKETIEYRNGNSIRIGFILFMLIQLLLYILSLVILSYYHTTTKTEKFYEFLLIININLNAMIFFLAFNIYILYMKNEFTCMISNLETRIASELYIDLEEGSKNIL